MPLPSSKHYTDCNSAGVIIMTHRTKICHKAMAKSDKFNSLLKMQKHPTLQIHHATVNTFITEHPYAQCSKWLICSSTHSKVLFTDLWLSESAYNIYHWTEEWPSDKLEMIRKWNVNICTQEMIKIMKTSARTASLEDITHIWDLMNSKQRCTSPSIKVGRFL
jgi:hypothetical protein